jgi:hypothetical protein
MADIREYRTVIDFQDTTFFLKGVVDGDPKYDPNPPYWLHIKVSPNGKFSGETELFVSKESIMKLADDLAQMHKETKGCTSIKCSGWGSYIGFEIGKSGELYISGLLNKRWDEGNNHMKFKFTSDQTLIPLFIQILKELTSD